MGGNTPENDLNRKQREMKRIFSTRNVEKPVKDSLKQRKKYKKVWRAYCSHPNKKFIKFQNTINE